MAVTLGDCMKKSGCFPIRNEEGEPLILRRGNGFEYTIFEPGLLSGRRNRNKFHPNGRCGEFAYRVFLKVWDKKEGRYSLVNILDCLDDEYVNLDS